MTAITDHRNILFRDKALTDLTAEELRDALAQALDIAMADDTNSWTFGNEFSVLTKEDASAPLSFKEYLAHGAELRARLADRVSYQAIFQIRSGPRPARCEDPDHETSRALVTLAADDVLSWNYAGPEEFVMGEAEQTGTATYFRVYGLDPQTCVMQGSVSDNPDYGDIRLEGLVFTAGQPVKIMRHKLSFE